LLRLGITVQYTLTKLLTSTEVKELKLKLYFCLIFLVSMQAFKNDPTFEHKTQAVATRFVPDLAG